MEQAKKQRAIRLTGDDDQSILADYTDLFDYIDLTQYDEGIGITHEYIEYIYEFIRGT